MVGARALMDERLKFAIALRSPADFFHRFCFGVYNVIDEVKELRFFG